jgi:hypothetical protein
LTDWGQTTYEILDIFGLLTTSGTVTADYTTTTKTESESLEILYLGTWPVFTPPATCTELSAVAAPADDWLYGFTTRDDYGPPPITTVTTSADYDQESSFSQITETDLTGYGTMILGPGSAWIQYSRNYVGNLPRSESYDTSKHTPTGVPFDCYPSNILSIRDYELVTSNVYSPAISCPTGFTNVA